MRLPGRLIVLVSLFGALAQAEAQRPAPPLPLCGVNGVSMPVMQTKMSLEDSYPPLSVALGEEGPTVVDFTVNRNGTVSDALVIESSGFPRLDDASMSAMKQMLYSQPKRGDAPVDCVAHLKIVWKLNGPPPDPAAAPQKLVPPQSLYPAGARAEHREGAALIAIAVGTDGNVREMKVIKSSGSDDLDDASMAYVKALRIRGAQIDGRYMLSGVDVIVVWTLDPKEASSLAHGKP